ncbi:MAG: NAD-binding protein [Deltaproteobacteria bacterium]|nr:NAD-binding protein [Deltaproteobacteria bacterium]
MGSERFGENISRVIEQIRQFYGILKKEKFFQIIAVTGLFIIYGALAIFFADRYYHSKGTGGIFDAIYWAIVTITTVGYGDLVPSSRLAKIFALMIILSGPALLSLITASVASILVERKIREGKGLESVKDKNHIIICGWNDNGEKVIEGVLQQTKGTPQKLVLVNELDRDEVQSIQYKYKDFDLQFVRGNFVKEDVLDRANMVRAKAAIVLADVSGGHTLEKADERTIFGTMAIKSMASKVRTCAELIHAENREHLIRTNVDEIIVRGESAGSLLATAATSPGMVDTVKAIINNQDENKLWRVPVPSKYVGKSFGDLSASMRQRSGAVLLAVVKEAEGVKLEDILSDDSTFIDEFIRRKFQESGKDFFGARKGVSVFINPPDDYELGDNDWVVALSKDRPAESGLVGRLVGGGA